VSRTMLTALLWAAGTVGAPWAAAQEPRRVSLDEALLLFNSYSLELRVARADARGAAARMRQAAAYPNPVLGAIHETLSDDGRGYNETYLTVAQQFRWPWERAAQGRAAAAGREASAYLVASDSLRLAFDVKRAFVEATSAERIRDGLAETTGVVRDALQHAARRVAEGDLSGYTLRRLRVERARYEAELSAAALGLETARRMLTALVLPDSAVVLAPAALPTGGPPDLDAWAASSALAPVVPALAAARAGLDAARASEQSVRQGRVPAPQATAGYKSQSDGLTGAFLGLSLPLPLFDRQGAAVEEAAAATARAESYLALVRRQTENDLYLAHEAYRASRERARLFEGELLSEPEALLSVARVAYAEGEMSLVELLDAVDAYRAARLGVVETRRDLWISFFNFERAAGGLPAGPEGDR
jgi:cobalt-zinc-cadmium efflux system outer membrane protein